ncbi:MAG: hypothetical protein B6245_13595 [Desulfobacteraceae bacterium 4572_88]|nr:MAG: hypothetical protein B6245_13595 [Desulfobacteraceae bacterium 4572_88]
MVFQKILFMKNDSFCDGNSVVAECKNYFSHGLPLLWFYIFFQQADFIMTTKHTKNTPRGVQKLFLAWSPAPMVLHFFQQADFIMTTKNSTRPQ